MGFQWYILTLLTLTNTAVRALTLWEDFFYFFFGESLGVVVFKTLTGPVKEPHKYSGCYQ